MSESEPRARSWRDVRAAAIETGQISEDGIAAARATHAEQDRAYLLRQIRKNQSLSQVELAAAMRVSQPRVSAIERGDLGHTELATLRAYVEALGGALRVTAQFGEDQVLLLASPAEPPRRRRGSRNGPTKSDSSPRTTATTAGRAS